MRKLCLLILLTLAALTGARGQASGGPAVITKAVVVDGDTLPHVWIKTVRCYANRKFKDKRAAARYNKLVRNVRKTLPYARIAAARLVLIEDSMAKLPNDRAREKFMKQAEKDLKAEFEAPLKKLTISQGRVLIKLIDRETGRTSYNLIKQLRGSFSAFIWQGVARMFGSTLKSEYDAEGEDKAIEYIVNAIDAGAYDDL